MSGIAENGIYLKNIGGKIAYSADGIDWLTTEVASVFDDSEYSRDMFGNEHGALFGADSKIENEIKITSGGSGYLHVYMPYPQEGVLIEKRETCLLYTSVIGHELSHAFDLSGAQYGENGNAANWWTDEDKKTFEALCQRVVDYFDGAEAAPGRCV